MIFAVFFALQDLALTLAKGTLQADTHIQPWVKAAWYVSEGTPIRDVLQLMQKYRLDMVMVREDEFNGTAGLVTLTDLVNEIIGGDDQPTHTQMPQIQEQDNHTFIIQAQTDLETVNERLAIDLPLVENYQTLGGFLLYQVQKLPRQGETYAYQNLELTVLAAEGPPPRSNFSPHPYPRDSCRYQPKFRGEQTCRSSGAKEFRGILIMVSV